MHWCETRGVDDLFGLALNARRVARFKTDLGQAAEESLKTGRAAQCFKDYS